MNYIVDFTEDAKNDIVRLKRSEPQVYKKLSKLLEELTTHPAAGTGHPKPLGNNKAGYWSRRITDKHCLVYLIYEETVTVLVISSYGHYDDK